jgi:hypothetical protein
MNSMNVTERTLSDRKGGHLARRRDSGRPSLVACDALKVTGDIRFTPGRYLSRPCDVLEPGTRNPDRRGRDLRRRGCAPLNAMPPVIAILQFDGCCLRPTRHWQ